jgi:hypothetical protein
VVFLSTKQLTVTTCTGLPEQDVEIDTRLSVFTIDEDDCSGSYSCLEWNDHIDQTKVLYQVMQENSIWDFENHDSEDQGRPNGWVTRKLLRE